MSIDGTGTARRISLLKKAAFGAGVLFCLTPWASPPAALALGLLLALTVGNPLAGPSKKVIKPLLQTSVVLLGFGMELGAVLKAGSNGLVFAICSIALTFALGYWSGRWLRVSGTLSTLISAGTAICGGSAIAAVGSVIGAPEGDMSVALGTVFILNAVALYLFPFIGHRLGLTPAEFGQWAGIAIHDVSSVVGAAHYYGGNAVESATAIKLSRTLWIVPVTLFAAKWMKAEKSSGLPGADLRKKIQPPWFIGLFLLAALVNSEVHSGAVVWTFLAHVAGVGLTLTLYLIGAGLSRRVIGEVGWRPLAQGLILWTCISLGSLLVIAGRR